MGGGSYLDASESGYDESSFDQTIIRYTTVLISILCYLAMSKVEVIWLKATLVRRIYCIFIKFTINDILSGKPGVLIVTSGPGATNAVTPLQDALMDGVPLVVFSGQVLSAPSIFLIELICIQTGGYTFNWNRCIPRS
jgi:hypothetical protein